jgi:CarD family transcriptional regulator
MRVYELARELKLESSDVLALAKKAKVKVQSASSGLDADEVKKIKAEAKKAKKPAAKKKAPAKKPAAKKPAAKKKAPAKKPAAKKPAAKKAPAKKPAEKKPAAKKKAPAKKPAEKKPAAKKKVESPFSVDDKVVYPHHGAATIVKKERRVFDGTRTDFFVLEVAIDQLILRVPVEKAVDLGVRPVISKTAARRVLATFKEDPEEAGANWSRWYKLLTEKINSGDIYQVAEVVRDLTYAQQTKGISPALKRMLSKARLILASELRFALDLTEEDAVKRLDRALPKVEVEEED